MRHPYPEVELQELIPDETLRAFYRNPVKAYDQAYTRSHDYWNLAWDGFRKGMRSNIVDALHMKDVHQANILMDLFVDVVQRIRYAERKLRICLISRMKTNGTLHVSGSILALMDD